MSTHMPGRVSVIFHVFASFSLSTLVTTSILVKCKLFNFVLAPLNYALQGLSQNLETGCPKLAIVKFLGVQIFKGDHNILRFQP